VDKTTDDAVAAQDAPVREPYSSSKHGCTAAADPQYCSALERIIVPRAEKKDEVVVSLATHQSHLNQTAQKIVDLAKTKTNIFVILDCLTPLTNGDRVMVGSRKRGRFEGDNATAQIEAIETMDNCIRKHPMYHRIWDDVLDKKATVQRNAMDMYDLVMTEVSDEERGTTGKAPKNPLFAFKSSARKIENRATYHKVYLCQDAAAMAGTAVHSRSIIDNGQPGGTC